MTTPTTWDNARIAEALKEAGGGTRLYIADAAMVARQVRDDYQQRIATLEAELAAVLEVTVRWGRWLGHEDDDYRARYRELTGKEWGDE